MMTPQERDKELDDLTEAFRTFRNVASYIYKASVWIVAVGGAFGMLGYVFRWIKGG